MQIYTNLYTLMHVSAGPLVGHNGCEGHSCLQSLSTVTSQQTVSYSQCPVYCTPPLMVPRQARTTRIASNLFGTFKSEGDFDAQA